MKPSSVSRQSRSITHSFNSLSAGTSKMREQSIDIRGQRCTIQVYPMGKTVWLAVGEYTGERVRTTGKTALKAA